MQAPLFTLVASEHPLLYLDTTFFINLGLWLLLFVILRVLLWGPLMRLIAAREGGMEGARETARLLDIDARKKKAEYEAAQQKARARAVEERNKLVADAKRQENEILEETRGRIQAAAEAQRAEMRKQREAVGVEIKTVIPQLASDIATRVLGREVRA